MEPSQTRDLTGATVFVTGANRGLGAAFVTAALQRGAARVYAGAREPSSVPSADGVVPVHLDLHQPKSILEAAENCTDVDLLVSNAGAMDPGPIIGADAAHLGALFRANVFAQVELATAFRSVLVERAGGFLLIASVAALIASRSSPGYSASKAAGMMVGLGLRKQLADEGVEVSIVYPGFIDTDATASMAVPKASALSAAGQSLDAYARGEAAIFPDRYSQMLRDSLGDGALAAITDPFRVTTDLIKKFRADSRAGQ